MTQSFLLPNTDAKVNVCRIEQTLKNRCMNHMCRGDTDLVSTNTNETWMNSKAMRFSKCIRIYGVLLCTTNEPYCLKLTPFCVVLRGKKN